MSCSAGMNAAALNIPETSFAIEPLFQLLDHTLVLVAHPDDETACAALLQRARKATVLFCTDGAPSSQYFWGRYGSRRAYADIRFTEAKKSLAVVGKSDPEFLLHPQTHEPFRDQELYQDVAGAFVALAGKTENWQLDAIVAPAYEGGHPDHDACCFLAHLLGSELAVSVWEMPLYNRAQSGGIVHQKFVRPNGTEIIVSLTDDELEKRRAMFAGYASQPDASEFVNSSVEVYRPQVAYDFGLAPHAGQLNYEAWGWPMTGTQLCEAFQSCLHLAARTNGLASSQGTSKSVG